MGIRLAMGAQAGDVFKLVSLAGVAGGVVAALALTRLMTSLLFAVSAADPVTFAGVAILLTLVTIAACYLPARRATRVDPVTARCAMSDLTTSAPC